MPGFCTNLEDCNSLCLPGAHLWTWLCDERTFVLSWILSHRVLPVVEGHRSVCDHMKMHLNASYYVSLHLEMAIGALLLCREHAAFHKWYLSVSGVDIHSCMLKVIEWLGLEKTLRVI